MSYPLPFMRLSASKDTLVIGPGVESVRYRFDDPPSVPLSTAGLVLDANGYFGVKPLPPTAGDVTGPASATDDAVARYDGVSGKVIQNSVVLISDAGAISGVTTINGSTIPTQIGDVVGPAGATDNAVARYDGATGKLVQNSVVLISDAGAVSGVTTLNGSTIPSPIGDVVGPAGATSTALAVYNGATGKVIQNSTATLSGAGVLDLSSPATSGLTFANATASSGTGSVLSFYSELNFTTNWVQAGVALPAPANSPVSVSRIGNVVFATVVFPTTFGSAGVAQSGPGTSMDISTTVAFPVWAQPATGRTGYVGTFDSGAVGLKTGYWVLDASGIFHMYPEITNAQAATTWSGVGNTVALATAYKTTGGGTGTLIRTAAVSLQYTLDP